VVDPRVERGEVPDERRVLQAVLDVLGAGQAVLRVAGAGLQPRLEQLHLGAHVVEPARVVREALGGLAGLPGPDRAVAVLGLHVHGAVRVDAAPLLGVCRRRGDRWCRGSGCGGRWCGGRRGRLLGARGDAGVGADVPVRHGPFLPLACPLACCRPRTPRLRGAWQCRCRTSRIAQHPRAFKQVTARPGTPRPRRAKTNSTV
jgi:hypothetical protein